MVASHKGNPHSSVNPVIQNVPGPECQDGDGLTLAAPTLIDEEPQEPLVDESVAMVNSGASDVEVVEGDNPDTGLVVGDTKSAEVVEKQVSEMGHTVANAGGDLVEESKSKTADSERKD